MPKEKFFITTPIYYSNQPPHAGSAYTTLAADILARYHRLRGEKVFFLTGLDEHGAKMAEAAEKAGKDPQDFCNEMAVKFQRAWKTLNISNDGFLRTTDKTHIRAVQNALQRLWDNGFIYKGEYKGLYCVGCEQYLTESDLVDGKCPDHNREPEVLKEDSYFFKLSQFQPQLLEKIKNDEFKITPKERKKEIMSFLEKQDLQDVSISRKKVAWGIKLPFDESHTSYVWVDAFLNYLTGLGWQGKPNGLPEFWPPDVQFMAKDILRVHATIWPGLLLALGIPLPRQLFVHGFFTVNGKKMSKSLGNVLDPLELAEKYSVDAVRYFPFREISFGKDGDVSEQRLKERYNSNLANGLGNLLSRTLTMAEKYWKRVFPEIDINETGLDTFIHFEDSGVKISFREHIEESYKNLNLYVSEQFAFNVALMEIFGTINGCNLFVEKNKIYKPSEVFQDNREKINIALYNILETIRHIAWMLLPFIPETADKIFEQLGLNPEKEKKKNFEEAIKWGGLKPGTKIKKGNSLFPRI